MGAAERSAALGRHSSSDRDLGRVAGSPTVMGYDLGRCITASAPEAGAERIGG
jgi:hypothetical protein